MDRVLLKKNSIGAGVGICVSFIILFFIMEKFRLVHNVLFMLSYFVTLFFGIFFSFQNYKHEVKNGIGFLAGITIGGFTTIVGVIPFIVFFYIYCTTINPDFLLHLNGNISGRITSPVTSIIPMLIALVGLFSGAIFTFILALFEKRIEIQKD